MTPLVATLSLRSALGTPLAGDTFFGQLCHAVREASGTDEVSRLLDGYTNGQPWLVLSDGFPHGYLPRPTMPPLTQSAAVGRKTAKGKRWIPRASATLALPQLLDAAANDETAWGIGRVPKHKDAHHNTINRCTGTTGTGEFAPYTQAQTFYAVGQLVDLHLVLDTSRYSVEKLDAAISAIGAMGFGRDASIGLGKFDIESITIGVSPAPTGEPSNPNAYWTLGPCAPQGQGFDSKHSYWRVMTRFGRHGGTQALGANPFKRPVLMACAGAIFTPSDDYTPRLFIGQGLGGVSHAESTAVHQGYAPVLLVRMESAR